MEKPLHSPSALESQDSLDVAVIGMAGRFPGATDLAAYWKNLAGGVESIQAVPENELREAGVSPELLRRPDYIKTASRLEGADLFDAEFFGYSPKEAAAMDPQNRLFLECSWHALEDAGYDPARYAGAVGVFAASSLNTYLLRNVHPRLDPNDFILSAANLPFVLGNGQDFLASRVSYKLNLRGPSIDVQTACSSALVAIHLARQSLLNGECDLAIAGGVSIYLPQTAGYLYQDGLILSKDGHCRVFDKKATGTIFGRGVGAVVLKPLAEALADGDRVLAVIKGSAINNDGADKVGFTAPSVNGQAAVIAEALANADLSADTISYVEAHGTGTHQGDPIEVAALAQAFRRTTSETGFCRIGSVKSNIGHLDAAAGIASFIKVVLMLQHRQIPPSLHCDEPNPEIDFSATPFIVNQTLRDWTSANAPRRAGVSSFGMGGTNAHLVLEEAPTQQNSREDKRSGQCEVLTLSARNEAALQRLAAEYAQRLETGTPLAELCFTANTGRARFNHRCAVIGTTPTEVAVQLRDGKKPVPSSAGWTGQVDKRTRRELSFLFTGQGSQYLGMGREFYRREAGFRKPLDRCAAILQPVLKTSLTKLIFGEEGATGNLDQTGFAQPALFALEYSLAQYWLALGLEPKALIGHSLGEYVAACVAGVWSVEDALALVVKRSSLMQALPAGGGMAAIFASEEKVRAALQELGGDDPEHVDGPLGVGIAAVNGPRNIVISGRLTGIEKVLAHCRQQGIDGRSLSVSHAFHSPLMEPMLAEFQRFADSIKFSEPKIPVISNLTGALITPGQWTKPDYWVQHIRKPVQFAAGMTALENLGCRIHLEIGPHPTLCGMGQFVLSSPDHVWIPSLQRKTDDDRQISEAKARLFVAGIDLNWAADSKSVRQRIALPVYPFERVRHWIEAVPAPSFASPAATFTGSDPKHPLLAGSFETPPDTKIFAMELGVNRPEFLQDHVVGGQTVFPATGFIEVVAAAAREPADRGSTEISGLHIHQALLLTADSTHAQVVVTPGPNGTAKIKIHRRDPSAGGKGEWTFHAEAEVAAPAAPHSFPALNVAGIRERLSESSTGAAYYDKLSAEGFLYGSAFRGISAIARREGEALAAIEVPAAIANDLAAYRAHPALFDACLQGAFAALPISWERESANVVFLPVTISKICLYGDLVPRMHAHLQLRTVAERMPASCLCDVRVHHAETGALIARVEGIELRRVHRDMLGKARSEVAQHLYEVQWQASPIPKEEPVERAALGTVEPVALAHQLEALLPAQREAQAMQELDQLAPQLDALSSAYAASALRALGWDLAAGSRMPSAQLAERFKVAPLHRHLLARLVEILAEDGSLRREGDDWRVEKRISSDDTGALSARLSTEFPRWRNLLAILHRCGTQLAGVLSGRTDPLQVLFAGGSLEAIEALYTTSPFTLVYNALVREAIKRAVAELPAGRKLRVLEIGAGTGGTTRHVLPELPAEWTEYVYTDMSPLFLAQARERFREYPFVDYRILDIGKDPSTQNFAFHQADLIVASNVLHATPDLARTIGHVRDLLAPSGLILLVEGISKQRWVDIIFGLTEGWWNSTDVSLRHHYPLISPPQWRQVLADAGFTQPTTVPGDGREAEIFQQAVILARGPAQPALAARAARTWLIFADRGGVGEQIAQRLRATGAHAQLFSPFPSDGPFESNLPRIDLTSATEIQGWLESFGGVDDLEILSAWPLDISSPSNQTTAELEKTEQRAITASLNLVQSVLRAKRQKPPRLWWLTRGAQAVYSGCGLSLPQVTLSGLAKTIAGEHPELRLRRIDLDPWTDLTELDCLTSELLRPDSEDEIAYRHGERLAPRLERGEGKELRLAIPTVDSGSSFRLTVDARQGLTSLRYEATQRVPPKSNEVEIDVRATGLNFKDVLGALGLYPGAVGPLGGECAGVITAVGDAVKNFSVGDEVMAFARGAFAAFVTLDAAFVIAKPTNFSFEQAATMPGAYLTAHYALVKVARLQPGEKILVHAGAGGVGMAAIAIARLIGAQVYATAGSPEKRAWLKNLGVAHVMDSRSANSLSELKLLPKSEGIDVVLNSLSGDFVSRSLDLLAPAGRFIELGKRDLLDEAQVAALPRRIVYHALDLAEMARGDPHAVAVMLQELQPAFVEGRLQPLPLRVFPIEETRAGFEFMAGGRHLGKICIAQQQLKTLAGRSIRETISNHASYLITGGLGGLGLETTRWLVRQGAKHIALLGRGSASAEAKNTIVELRSEGVQIHVIAGDVGLETDVHRAIDEIAQNLPPLRGVVHAAGTLSDALIPEQDWAHFQHVFGAKVFGAWNLHRATAGLPLDFFVLYSSAAAVLGTTGQANHVAANAFLDGLAHWRRAQGQPAISINWGAWGQIGAVSDAALAHRLSLRGLKTIAPSEGVQLLEEILERNPAQITAMAVDWSLYLRPAQGRVPRFFDRVTPAIKTTNSEARNAAKPALDLKARLSALPPARIKHELQRALAELIATALGLDGAQSIDFTQPLSELGVDSLLAVELRHRLSAGLGLERSLPATLLFDYPTVEALTEYIAKEAMGLHLTDKPSAAASFKNETELKAIAALSDAEAEALLLRELDEELKD